MNKQRKEMNKKQVGVEELQQILSQLSIGNDSFGLPISKIIQWLLKGDVSIQYQVYRDLLKIGRIDLQNRIEQEGWGAKFLSKRKSNGLWGQKFYQPKWISANYTLLDLRNLCISPNQKLIKESIDNIAFPEMTHNADSPSSSSILRNDICVNGMFLNYASYFKTDEKKLWSTIDFILSQKMKDGGYNCQFIRSGAKHSSLHSTLTTLEGLTEYELNGYTYRLNEVKEAIQSAKEFILLHQLFISDRTGEIIHKDFLRLAYPRRWKYDVLSVLDYFQYSGTPWDERMYPAIEMLIKKRNKDGTWNVQAKYPGQTHFDMEKAGRPSLWNTLRALRVLSYYGIGMP